MHRVIERKPPVFETKLGHHDQFAPGFLKEFLQYKSGLALLDQELLNQIDQHKRCTRLQLERVGFLLAGFPRMSSSIAVWLCLNSAISPAGVFNDVDAVALGFKKKRSMS